MPEHLSSRRKFLTRTSALVAGTAGLSTIWPQQAAGRTTSWSPNEQVTVGLIGCKGMGFYNLQDALKVEGVVCAALCDVDANILEQRKADLAKLQSKPPALYKDFRQLIDRKDIDAVIIGTPDHWHCLPFVYACQAGKDVYVEKPLANSIAECDVMVRATRKYNRVVQVGQQQRSGTHWKQAMDFIAAGNIGQLRKVHIWANFNYGIGSPVAPDAAPPPHVDYDLWLGPAPLRPFNPNRFHGSWRMFWDYGGGLMTDWGVHLIDMALWAKGVKDAPRQVMASGGNWAFKTHAHETFDTMSTLYQLDDFTISWEHTAGIQSGPYDRPYGLAFVGDNATLVADRGGWELFPEKENGQYKVPALPKQSGTDAHPAHLQNFIDCIRDRKDPVCTVENGRLVALYAHMGNIALRSGQPLTWNEQTRNFGVNHPANAFIQPDYRKPWTFPQV